MRTRDRYSVPIYSSADGYSGDFPVKGFLIGFAVVAGGIVWLAASLDQDHQERMEHAREYYSACKYAGSRVERWATVYMYDCDGVREETIRRWKDASESL